MKSAVVMLSLVFLFSCSSSSKKNTTSPVDDTNLAMETKNSLQLNGSSDAKTAGQLSTVFFDYKSSRLSKASIDALNKNIAFLKSNTSVKIQIEGHTDERGSVQYNLTLGEKRALAVYDYFISNDVPGSRLSTISIGKESPLMLGHDEQSWAENRRANFVITEK